MIDNVEALARHIAAKDEEGLARVSLRVGVVDEVTGSKATTNTTGDAQVSALDGLALAPGQRVIMLSTGRTVLIIGTVAASLVDHGDTSGTRAVNVGTAVSKMRLVGSTTLSLNGFQAGVPTTARLVVRQDAVGGRSLSWPVGTKIASGSAQSGGANSTTTWEIYSDDGGITVLARALGAFS